MDTKEERILGYALDGISRELQVLDRTFGKEHIMFQDLHEFYVEVYDMYEQETIKNTL